MYTSSTLEMAMLRSRSIPVVLIAFLLLLVIGRSTEASIISAATYTLTIEEIIDDKGNTSGDVTISANVLGFGSTNAEGEFPPGVDASVTATDTLLDVFWREILSEGDSVVLSEGDSVTASLKAVAEPSAAADAYVLVELAFMVDSAAPGSQTVVMSYTPDVSAEVTGADASYSGYARSSFTISDLFTISAYASGPSPDFGVLVPETDDDSEGPGDELVEDLVKEWITLELNSDATFTLLVKSSVEVYSPPPISPPHANPEPASVAVWSLLGAVAIAIGWRRRRKPA
jgi:hypothetical protein